MNHNKPQTAAAASMRYASLGRMPITFAAILLLAGLVLEGLLARALLAFGGRAGAGTRVVRVGALSGLAGGLCRAIDRDALGPLTLPLAAPPAAALGLPHAVGNGLPAILAGLRVEGDGWVVLMRGHLGDVLI